MFQTPVRGRGRAPAAITGLACRLPGAPDLDALDSLLDAHASAIRPLPAGRWRAERFLHPNPGELGRSYSFAGGYLDAPFDFDPAPFGISPREALQMDPQQRLLLEVVWEALEDAGLSPDQLRGSETGVYVGASSLDHSSLFGSDPAAIDGQFMTGNTLSIIANRLSHVFDWHGPSHTVDTACSSSLVALAQALGDLRSGRVRHAVVAGVNMLLSPIPFIGFSRAGMISRSGLCRPFSSDGDGYVRAEGAVAIVLCAPDDAPAGAVRAMLVDAAVNSDGQTPGIALPGLAGQVALLRRIYDDGGIDAEELAFVEAHGTGTRVGDPIEAEALGQVLGRRRTRPLPIGSIKSNLGHLEPASGLAGLAKAVRALERRRLPASLHIDPDRPLFDFAALGLSPAHSDLPLAQTGLLLAGVSSFGFGGTNAHAVVQSAPVPAAAPDPVDEPPVLVLSAATTDALRELAGRVASRLSSGARAEAVAAQARDTRPAMAERLAIALDTETAAHLARFAASGDDPLVMTGMPTIGGLCFVYPGNGTQWVGMGRTAFARNPTFRETFLRLSNHSVGLCGQDLAQALFAEDLATRLAFTHWAQPLIVAVEAALTQALQGFDVRPDMVIGHSLGEVAAAHAAGLLDDRETLRIVQARATLQERLRGEGRMLALAADLPTAHDLIAASGVDGLCVAAENGPRSVSISGGTAGIDALARLARRRRIAARLLPLDYPFHNALLDALEAETMAALGQVSAGVPNLSFLSGLVDQPVRQADIDAAFWWRNMREPVRFAATVQAAVDAGAGIFLELGARPVLLQAMRDTLDSVSRPIAVIAGLGEGDDGLEGDPVARIAARVLAHRLPVPGDLPRRIDRANALPHYPFQRRTFHSEPTPEMADVLGWGPAPHPLLGARLDPASHEWRSVLDPALLPQFGDHRVDGEPVLPATAMAEVGLAAARQLWPDAPVAVEEVDLVAPLPLRPGEPREVRLIVEPVTGRFRLASRARLSGMDWVTHASGRLSRVVPSPPSPPAPPAGDWVDAELPYARALEAGLDYGPAFRLLHRFRHDGAAIEADLLPAMAAGPHPFGLDPMRFDACLHALLGALPAGVAQGAKLLLPVRFGRVALHRPGGTVATTRLRLDWQGEHAVIASVLLLDEAGNTVATVEGVVLRQVDFTRARPPLLETSLTLRPVRAVRPAGWDVPIAAALGRLDTARLPDGWLLLRAWLRSLAHEALTTLAEAGRRVSRAMIAPDATATFDLLVPELLAGGLVRRDGPDLRLAARSGLPPRDAILRSLLVEAPDASAELLLALGAGHALARHLRDGSPLHLRQVLRTRLAGLGIATAPLCAMLASALAGSSASDPLRVLVPAAHLAWLEEPLASALQAGTIRLGILVDAQDDRAALAHWSGVAEIVTAAPGTIATHWDLGLLWGACPAPDLDGLAGRLAPHARLCVLLPPEDALLRLLAGDAGRPSTDWPTLLERSGWRDVSLGGTGEAGGGMLARPPLSVPEQPGAVALALVGLAGDPDWLDVMAGDLAALGHIVTRSPAAVADAHVVCVVASHLPASSAEPRLLASHLAELGHLLADLASRAEPPTVWVLASGADVPSVSLEALEGYVRVAINEVSGLDLHLLVAPQDRLVEAFAMAAVSDHPPRVVHWTGAGPATRQLVPLPPARPLAHQTLRPAPLRAAPRASWRPAHRTAPGPGQVEIEVLATGLNFRDVMVSAGLLQGEFVDGGFAGASLGFECAGRILRTGPGVDGLAAGELVAAVAPNALAGHVLADAAHLLRLPDGLDPLAAAALPVAFLTAWYALADVGRLRRGETILVHGAAGAVGLAAIQIARQRGARVAATASTDDKRGLARLYGADLVADSRSLDFAATIREAWGGVDVVLNSLADAPMRESLHLLNPFGRFLELGKRDFAANTVLGLRPFRDNISYHGIDLDRLLATRPALVKRGLAQVASGMRSGRFSAPPVFAFRPEEAGEALRLMQQGAHAGKVVVRPASAGPDPAPEPHRTSGAWLVVGGTRGFGFETALRLAASGRGPVVIAGRSGDIDPALAARLGAAREAGQVIDVERLDVRNRADVEALVARIAGRHGALAGVVHSAMDLNDGALGRQDAATIAGVLAPKLAGAQWLDLATRAHPGAQLIVYSSVAAIIGNPGQSAYAAANAGLEAVVRARRDAGLPALAIAWGPIADAGVLTRDGAASRRLARRGAMIAAEEALDWLMQRLDRGLRDLPDMCVVGRLDPALLAALPLLGDPAYALLAGDGAKPVSEDGDIAAAVARLADREALALVTRLAAEEVARVLRMKPEDLDLRRPLDSLGMDSLMGVELKLALDARYGLDVPFSGVSSVSSLDDLGRRILSQLRGAAAHDPATAGLDTAERLLYLRHRDTDASEGAGP